MIYLDANATTSIPKEVFSKMEPFLKEEFGNAGNTHYRLGEKSHLAIENARKNLALLIGCKESEVIFTSGATESCFSAIVGSFLANKNGNDIASSTVEHPAVVSAIEFLKENFSPHIDYFQLNNDLSISDQSKDKQYSLAIKMFANNETGICNDITKIKNKLNTLVLSDAAQAVGKIVFSFKDLNIDFLSLSGHKFGAPKGVGALIVKDGTCYKPVITGGGQEAGRRGGTQAVSQIVGLGEAAKYRQQQINSGALEKIEKLRDNFENELKSKLSDLKINGKDAKRLPNTSNITISGIVASDFVKILGEEGICLSAGSACHSGSMSFSPVLKAIGLTDFQCMETIRVSLPLEIKERELEKALEKIVSTAKSERDKNREKMSSLV